MRCAAIVVSLCCVIGCDSDSSTPTHSDAAAPGTDATVARDATASNDDAGANEMDAMTSPPSALRIVVFSRTAGYQHEAIGPGLTALSDFAARHGARFEMTEDPAQLAAKLPATDVVVFLMTTGDVLGAAEQTQLETFIRNGGGFLGVHSAADTEYDWPFYETLNGAWFSDHPSIQAAKVVRASGDHPATSFLPAVWERTDEWYNFRSNPRGRVQVLLTLDEKSYQGGTMGDDHPIAWSHSIDRGRAFYTALGHTLESWKDPLFLEHIERSLVWTAGR